MQRSLNYLALAIQPLGVILLTLLSSYLAPRPLQAQSIIAAPDDTQTLVTPNGSQFDISGGQLSPDQLNQFHSFLRFGLNSGEIANFLANPNLQNILARVVGGDPSVINGLLQVSGGNPNLYLLNPAGVIFGPTASLNVPAAFTATTANGIQVGSSWFNASGTNDFSSLSGTPNAFAFSMSQPGAIANFGNLSVNSGQSLALLGGTVVSTGSLNAPGGQLLVTAIPGQSLVRLSQPGNLLSLDIQPLSGSSPVTPLPFSPATLPQLLTAGSGGNATGVTVNANGTIDLTGSGLAIAPGDVVVRNASAQTLTLRANQNLTLVNSQLQSTGDLNLFAQNAVQVRDSATSPFIASSGGQLYLQGNQAVDIFALNNPASGFFSGGNMLFRSANTISADAHFFSGGNFQIQQLNGQLGSFFSPYDPIIRASGDVSFDSYEGPSLHILAGGSVIVTGLIDITDIERFAAPPSAPVVETVTLSDGSTISINGLTRPTLDIRAGTTNFGSPGITPGAIAPNVPANPATTNPATGSTISIGQITINVADKPGQVFLTNRYAANPSLAGGTISVGSILTTTPFSSFPTNSNGGPVTIDSSGAISIPNGINASASESGFNGGNLTLLAQGSISTGDLDASAITGNGGLIRLISQGGAVTTGSLASSVSSGTAGNVTITAPGNVSANVLNSSASAGTGGAIAINAGGTLTLNSLDTGTGNNGLGDAGTSGSIALTANSNVTISGPVKSNSTVLGNAANVQITSQNGNITTGLIDTSTANLSATPSLVNDGTAGAITLNATRGSIVTGSLNTSSTIQGGNVTLQALNSITTDGINTSATQGNAGNVFIDPIGDVQVSFINAEGLGGIGGNIDITAGRFFRATGGFSSFLVSSAINTSTSTFSPSTLVSLSASGRTANGTITIRHGGNGVTSFVVGDASVNGTAYAIASVIGNSRLNTTNILLPRQSFPLSYTQGKIALSTGAPQSLDPQLSGRDGSGEGDGTLAIKPACGISGAASGFASAEAKFTNAYEEYLGRTTGGGGRSADNACDTLVSVAQATGVRPALIYVSFVPVGTPTEATKDRPKMEAIDPVLWRFTSQGMAIDTLAQNANPSIPRLPTDQLELVMVTTKGIIRKRVPQTTRAEVLKLAQQFRSTVTNPQTNDYLVPSQQLYKWIVAPLETALKAEEIDSIAFLMDTGLRSLPIAALHDGKKFIIETYSVGLMPSLSLTDTRFVSIRDAEVLAMGASQFRDQAPLPAVPLELATIIHSGRSGKAFINNAFTVSNLKLQRGRDPYRIVHLATHGEFRPGSLKDSYIQFSDARLGLDRVRLLGLSDPPVELLVLSACRTALGNEEAELGFGGLAVQSGVKSALASLWYVSDEGTLGLMSQFYQDLATSPIKAEALRRTQLAMLNGQIRLEPGQLRLVDGTIALPPELQNLEAKRLSHPYYWAAFTMIGSPW